MSREIRRVPANWEHPTYENRWRGEVFKPLLGRDFSADMAEYQERQTAWDKGKPGPDDVSGFGDGLSFEQWAGEPPEADSYVTYDVNGDLPWWQMYETVTEGTPVTPAFATPDELIAHLAKVGEAYDDGTTSGPWARDRARQFVMNEKWFPSAVFVGGEEFTAKEGWPESMRAPN